MKKSRILKASAITIDVAVPAVVTLTQFPVWIEGGSKTTASGLALVLLTISCVPFFKQIKEYMKSPDAWVMWVCIFVAMEMFKAIAEQICIIALFGAAANIIGAVIYTAGKKAETNEQSNTDHPAEQAGEQRE